MLLFLNLNLVHKMKITEMRDAYYEASTKASEIVRQLGLAGIAVVWIFRAGTENGGVKFTNFLLWPLALFVVSLFCDLLQYLYKCLLWGGLNKYHWNKQGENEADVEVSPIWNWPTITLFWLKIIVALAGYVLLFQYILSQILANSASQV